MTRTQWKSRILALPPGLTQPEVAKVIGVKTCTARYWLLKYGYKFKDGRSEWTDGRLASVRTFNYDAIDWKMRDCDLARKHGVSRERIRQIRNKLGKKKIKRTK